MDNKVLQKGMYVRCPFDIENEEIPRVFISGQISDINEGDQSITVKFHDLSGITGYMEHIPSEKEFRMEEVQHCELKVESEVKYVLPGSLKVKQGHIIWKAQEKEDGYYCYYLNEKEAPKKIHKVRENRIDISLDKGFISPVKQMLTYELQNPRWYMKRTTVSKFISALANAPQGFKELVGARAYLFPHQIDTIMRASKEEHCRLMLADEVGLGKTIEALIIANILQKTKKDFKTLIIVPKALMNQWKNEFDIKLWIDAKLYGVDIDFNQIQHLIVPLEEVNQPQYRRVIESNWDLLIVDEVHNILNIQGVYEMIYRLSQKVEHILLLSATPITIRRTEYLNLLKLLKPHQYSKMNEKDFEILVERNGHIKENVCRCRDYLEEYYQDGEEDTGYLEDIKDCLETISDEVQDELIERIIREVNPERPEESLEWINKALAYIAEYYQIDRDIIRHRRTELDEKFAKRSLIKCTYMMGDSISEYYEYETYMALLDCISKLKEYGDAGEIIKELLNAMFSSPFALEEIIQVSKLESKVNIEVLQDHLTRYKRAVEKEIEDIKENLEHAEIIGRFTTIADYIEQEVYDKKIIVFSKYTATAAKVYDLLTNLYPNEPVMRFYEGLTYEELMENMDGFQNNQQAKILVCDYLAGEGRNLQMADCILHVDLPISPNDIEQRIGRLDRIGRNPEQDVVSVVFVANETIEEDLLYIWDEALNIFGESLSGLEIALKELQEDLIQYLSNSEQIEFKEFLQGFKEKVGELKEVLEEERFNDANRQLSKRFKLLIEELIEQVDHEEGKALATVMKSWGGMVGLINQTENGRLGNQIIRYTSESFSLGSFRKAWYVPPSTSEILKRSKQPHELTGTFSRKKAIERENMAFFAPGEPIFDSLLQHGINSYQGTCCAIQVNGDVEFAGYIVNWKTGFNLETLLVKDIDLSKLNHIKAYEISKIESEVYKLAGEDLSIEQIEEYINVPKKQYVHLGERAQGNGNIYRFMEMYPTERWHPRVKKAIEVTKRSVRERADERIRDCRRRFRRNYQMEQKAIQSANAYYNKNIEHSSEDLVCEALLKGMQQYKLEIDSIVYVRVVKRDGC